MELNPDPWAGRNLARYFEEVDPLYAEYRTKCKGLAFDYKAYLKYCKAIRPAIERAAERVREHRGGEGE